MAEYIERADLEFPYMTMAKWGLNIETCHAYNEGVKAAADYIASIPTADVAPVVRGEWVDDYYDPRFICQECGKWFLVEDATGDMNFCPNCGADMRERKGDDGNEA